MLFLTIRLDVLYLVLVDKEFYLFICFFLTFSGFNGSVYNVGYYLLV